jgi:hypothetical protein
MRSQLVAAKCLSPSDGDIALGQGAGDRPRFTRKKASQSTARIVELDFTVYDNHHLESLKAQLVPSAWNVD